MRIEVRAKTPAVGVGERVRDRRVATAGDRGRDRVVHEGGGPARLHAVRGVPADRHAGTAGGRAAVRAAPAGRAAQSRRARSAPARRGGTRPAGPGGAGTGRAARRRVRHRQHLAGARSPADPPGGHAGCRGHHGGGPHRHAHAAAHGRGAGPRRRQRLSVQSSIGRGSHHHRVVRGRAVRRPSTRAPACCRRDGGPA